MPLLRGEFPSAIILRRKPANLLNAKWARLSQGGGTDGQALSYLSIDYTEDLTGATGWAPLCGGVLPVVGTADQGGTVCQHGPWAPIVEAAKTLVLLRVVGAGGNGVASPTFADIDLEVSGQMLYEEQSLEAAPQGTGVLLIGGSLMGGGGTEGTDPGEKGELSVPDRVIPDDMTVIRGDEGGAASTLVAFSAASAGVEAGVAKRLAELGRAAGITLICCYVDATTAGGWAATHLDVAKTYCVNAGVTIVAIGYCSAIGNAPSDHTTGASAAELRALIGRCEEEFPGAAFIGMSCPSTDIVAAPKLADAKVVFDRRMQEPADGRRKGLDGTGIALQLDGVHQTMDGLIDQGGIFVDDALIHIVP